MSTTLHADKKTLDLIPAKLAWFYRLVPYAEEGAMLHCWIDESRQNNFTVEEVELFAGRKIIAAPVTSEAIQHTLETCYPKQAADTRQQDSYYHGTADSFLTHLIAEAKTLHSSDIHVEIYEEQCRVRLRIDGMLVQRYTLDKKQYPSLVNKIKIVANLDIAEKRLPQDGRILFEFSEKKIDIRVSVFLHCMAKKWC